MPLPNRTMITLGIDPDSKDLAIASWSPDGPLNAQVLHVVGSCTNYQMIDAIGGWNAWEVLDGSMPVTIALEGQQVDRRRTGKGDLFKLAHITGAMALRCRQELPRAKLLVPSPQEWKGKLAKHAHQGRLYQDLGWGYTIKGSIEKRTAYALPIDVPDHLKHITNTQWKHVGDAFLLAKWAYER
jgi:hypothetical protein